MAESKTVTVVPLSGSNYGTWKVQCRMALVKDGLWGIVSGTETAPASTEAEKFAKFVGRRDKALAIIVLSVDPSLLYLLGDPEDPVAVWKKLSDQFQKKTWANKLSLRRRLNNLRLKDGDSMSNHIKAMTEIFNELAVIGAAMEDEDKVVTLLASLPEAYNMLVTALEASTEVPQMEVVIERLLYEEKKLGEREKSPIPSRRVMVASDHKGNKKFIKCHHCGKLGHIRRFCKDLNKDKNKKESGNQGNKNKGNQVEKGQPGPRKESLGLVVQSLAASAGGIKSETWIVDSGATCHMCNNKALLEDFVEFDETVDVMLGDGKVLNATGSGTVLVHTVLANGKQQECILHNVLLVPNLSYNLISVSKVTEAGKSISFEEAQCNISCANGEVIATAKKVGCLYYLDFQPTSECSNAMVNEGTKLSNEMLWHQRYGHLGVQNLKKLANDKLVEGFNSDAKKNLEFCEACTQGKLHRCSFPISGATRASEPLGLVHSDLCGKVNTKSCGGAEYFLTFTDDKTRYVWVYPLKQKSDVFNQFLEWKAAVEKSSGHKVKTLRTDNGGEFTSTEFENYLKSEGVKHELTVPKTPEQNGVAERLNRTLVEAVRAMLIQAKLPQRFWVEALATAVYLHNRSPTKGVTDMTPFEAWTGVKPNVSHLRSFGCTVYAHIPKDERRKLDPKSKKCVLLGYGTETKGYRLYDPQSSRVMYSRDVKFNESEFGFEKNPDNEVQADKRVTLELSSEKEESEEDEVNNVEFNVPPPAREKRAPDRFGEWVTMASEDIVEPTTVSEALHSPHSEQWREAMQQEIDSLQEHDVYELTELPRGRRAVGCKWVFKIKHNADGSIERYKARLVAQGYSQRYGVDYDETFSPVVRFESIRTVIALSVQRGLKLHQIDVTSAFLNGELEDEVYMKQPEGFEVEGKEDLVYKLNKSLYGLKQSSRCWNSVLDEHLKSIGFVQTESDPCIYVKVKDGDIFIAAVWVDDIILAGKTDEEINNVKASIAERFQVKDMEELKYILGQQVIQENGKVWIGQPMYTENILKKFGMESCKPVETPVDLSSKLIKATDDSEMSNKEEYQQAVGCLLYLSSATRPDITFAVNNVAKFTANPTKEHWTAVKRIFRYLKGTINYGLLYSENASPDCVGFSDADWAGDLNDRKSTSGYTFQMSGATVSWRSKKQTCVALSTAEAEYIALSAATQEALWMRQLLTNLSVNIEKPITIYEDNQSAIAMSKNPQFHGRSKHIDIKHHFVRDQVEKKTVTVLYCPTGSMLGYSKGTIQEIA